MSLLDAQVTESRRLIGWVRHLKVKRHDGREGIGWDVLHDADKALGALGHFLTTRASRQGQGSALECPTPFAAAHIHRSEAGYRPRSRPGGPDADGTAFSKTG